MQLNIKVDLRKYVVYFGIHNFDKYHPAGCQRGPIVFIDVSQVDKIKYSYCTYSFFKEIPEFYVIFNL